MFGRRKEQDQRLLALENVLQETRLTLDGMFISLAGVLSHVPEIADDLRTAAECTIDAPVTEPDPVYRERVIASRDEISALLMAMAKVVDLNREKAGRLVSGSGAGVQ